jgi:hypothetical protein
VNIDRMQIAIQNIKALEGQLADYKRELVEAMNEVVPPVGVIPNGGAVIPARNPVTGRTRKARAARPRAGIKLDAAVVASVRQALEAASGPRTTAELVEATELRAPVVIAACREIGATQVAKGRGTKWNLCARVPIPADDDEPAEGDEVDEDDEDEGEVA